MQTHAGFLIAKAAEFSFFQIPLSIYCIAGMIKKPGVY